MSRPLLWHAAVLLATVLVVSTWSAAPASAAGTALAFAPASQTVAAGANGSVDVTVASVTNLGGYHLQVSFNAAAVHVTAMTDSGFLATGSNVIVCNPAAIDNTTGTAALDCASLAPFPPPGPGASTVAATPLAHVAFTAVAAGSSPLALTGSTLEDPSGAPIAATLGTGSITVTGAATPPAKVGGIAEMPDVASLPPPGGRADGMARWLLALAAVTCAAAAGLAVTVRRRRR